MVIPLMATDDGVPLTLYQRATLLTSFYVVGHTLLAAW